MIHYIWFREKHSKWVLVMVKINTEVTLKALSESVPSLPTSALFHRLDLLPPQEARVCRHFNQMATLGMS